MVSKILPRHLEIINYINFFFMEKIKKDFPGDESKLQRMSIIEVTATKGLFIRMAYICFLTSHKVNGVSMEHTMLLKELVFKEFNQMFPNRVISISNGVS
jgi:glycogen phosphorylase